MYKHGFYRPDIYDGLGGLVSDTSWSFSKYSTAQQCLQKYKLIYVDKVIPDQPPSGDLAFGSCIHNAIQAMFNNEDWELQFEIYWDAEKTKNNKYGRFNWEALKELGLRALGKFERLHLKKFKPMHLEKRLHNTYNRITIEGTPDFVGHYNDQLSLFDWKTSAYNYSKLKEFVSLQIYLYAFLAQKEYSIEFDRVGYVVFNKSLESIQVLEWAFDKAMQIKLLDELEKSCSNFNMRDFPKNPNACIMGQLTCEYFDKCWRNK